MCVGAQCNAFDSRHKGGPGGEAGGGPGAGPSGGPSADGRGPSPEQGKDDVIDAEFEVKK
jgi:hypothetical protein